MLVQGLVDKMIEPPRFGILFQLTVPIRLLELGEPSPEFLQFLRRQDRHGLFQFPNAHVASLVA